MSVIVAARSLAPSRRTTSHTNKAVRLNRLDCRLDGAVHDPEGLPLGQMLALYVNLMPKYQDLGYQRSSRPEQPDQRRPNKAARFPRGQEHCVILHQLSARLGLRQGQAVTRASNSTAHRCRFSRRHVARGQVQGTICGHPLSCSHSPPPLQRRAHGRVRPPMGPRRTGL